MTAGLTIAYLEKLGKKLAPNIFLGVYPCDISPNTNNKPVFAVIFNLSKHNEEGTHYVAIFVTQNSVTYFDSFGKKCTNSDIKKFILPHKVNKKFISNSIQVQHDESNFCGFFSLAFILSQVLNISLKKFLKLFTRGNLLLNDDIVTKYIVDFIKM